MCILFKNRVQNYYFLRTQPNKLHKIDRNVHRLDVLCNLFDDRCFIWHPHSFDVMLWHFFFSLLDVNLTPLASFHDVDPVTQQIDDFCRLVITSIACCYFHGMPFFGIGKVG